MMRAMSEELPASPEAQSRLHDPMETHDEESPCFPSLWKVVVIQSQNALNDKIAQYVLLGLAGLIPALTESQRESYPHVGALLLALPLILFAPLAGWLSDRYSKRSILFWCATSQWAAMAAISLCFYCGWFWAATFCFFVLATQATIFGPAKGGIVKELVGENHLSLANSYVQATGLVAIVAGPWLGGALFKWMVPHFPGEPEMAAFWPAFVLAIVSTLPVILALRVRRTPSHSQEKFRWGLLWEHFFHLKDLLGVRTLRLASFGISFFWFSATLLALLLIQVAQTITPDRAAQAELGGFLLVWVGIGIAAGSILVGVVSTNRIELGLIPLGGLGMALGCVAVAFPFFQMGGIIFNILMFFIGASSAVFLVPLNAYLQDQVEPAKRGRQLAASGLLDSLGMFFGIVMQYVWKLMGLSGETGARLQFIMLGALCLLTAIYVVRIIPQNFIRFVALALVKLTYRVRVEHGDRIPKQGGVLLIANHVSYIDAFIISAACERKVRFIASDQFHKMRFIGPILKLFDVVPVSPTRAKDAIVSVAEAVAGGDVVCIFPEGQITRSGVMNELRKGFELIARRGQVPVIPVFMDDLWGSVMSFERGRFFKKWPKRYAYQVSVSFGHPEPPETATAEWARNQFHQLNSTAITTRGELRTRLEISAVTELCRKPWRVAALGKNEVTRAMLLSQAWTLARRWTDEISGDRVAVLVAGYHGLVANLALRIGGYTPVNVSPDLLTNVPLLAASLQELGISAVIDGERPEVTHGLDWINLQTEMAAMDSLRLSMKIVSVYVMPKTIQTWWLRRKQHHVRIDQEAFGWLARDDSGKLQFRGLTHMDILMQSEQLSSMDVLREGDPVYSERGFANVEGAILGLWHTILQGGAVVSEAARCNDAAIFIGGADLARNLMATPPSDPSVARAFYCFDSDAKSLAEEVAEPLSQLRGINFGPSHLDNSTGRLLSISLPDAAIPTRTADPQLGTKPNALGRLIPGYALHHDRGKPCFISPDGVEIPLRGATLDAENFLFIQPG